MLITKEIGIDMGHRVPNHKSKCRNLHGHRYRIEVGVDDKVITEKGASNEGMVIDFGDLKQIMMDEIDSVYDHSFTIYIQDPICADWMSNSLYHDFKINIVPFIPTAENLAKYWFDILKLKLSEKKIKIKYVKVWETPSSTAIYEE